MWMLVLGCRPVSIAAPDDSEAVDSQPPQGDDSGEDSGEETGDSEEPQDTGPFDTDGDGHLRSEDCDDTDDTVFPGAEETFDGQDDDCDGIVDASGHYEGNHKWVARAWYQGEPHDFTVHCPTELDRGLVNAPWKVVCTTKKNDEWAQLLVGATLTLEPADDYLWELDRWSGDVVVTSSNGWDTLGEGSLVWKDMGTVSLTTALDTNYLDFTGTGQLKRD